MFVALITLGGLGQVQVMRGRLQQTAETYHQALHMARIQVGPDGALLPSAGKAMISYAELLYEWNQLDEAAQYFRQGMTLCQQWTHLDHTIQAHLQVL